MDSQFESAVTDYLDTLTQQLAGLPPQKRQDVRAEVLQHLEALTEADILLGGTPVEAVCAALRQFGEPSKIGRQIAREWRVREWRRRGMILLQTLVAPVSYVGIAALGTTVMAVTSLMTDGPEENYTLWLQRTYWLIGLEAVIKLGQAAFAMTGEANLATASYGSASSGGIASGLRNAPLNFAAFLSRLKPPRHLNIYLGGVALITGVLAIIDSVSVWPDDYTFRLTCVSWAIGLYLFFKWLLDRPEPFAAQQKARLKTFSKWLQRIACSTYRILGTPVRPRFILPSRALSDRRGIPLDTVRLLCPPFSYLSVAALSTITLAISSLVRGWPDEDYTFWLYRTGWLIGLDTLIKLLQEGPGSFVARRKAKSKIFIELIQPNGSTIFHTSGSDRRSVPLNTACFLCPPLGLISWLALDGSSPIKASSAGRSAVRGTVVALITLSVFNIWFMVHVAILAIGNAHLQPINPTRPFHSLRRKTATEP